MKKQPTPTLLGSGEFVKPRAIMWDVDGTLAHRDTRKPFEWDRVSEDEPDTLMFMIMAALYQYGKYDNLIVSGRLETCEFQTRLWINHYALAPITEFFLRPTDKPYEPDHTVKDWIYTQQIQPYWDVVAVFDDRNTVTNMWRRKHHLRVFQVADGDF